MRRRIGTECSRSASSSVSVLPAPSCRRRIIFFSTRRPPHSTKQRKPRSTVSSTRGSNAPPSYRSAIARRSPHFTVAVSCWSVTARSAVCVRPRSRRRQSKAVKYAEPLEPGSTVSLASQKAMSGGPGGAAARRYCPSQLFQIGRGRQIELAGHDEAGAAPIGAEPTRIDRGEARGEGRRVVARERVAVALVHVGVVIAEVEREHAFGDGEADVPRGVAAVRNAIRIRLRAGGSVDLRAVEVVARAEVPVARLARQEQSPALGHSGARRGELRPARYIGAWSAGIEHRGRVVHGATERDLVIDGVVGLGVALHEAQVLLDDVEVDRQKAVLEAVGAEHRVEAAVEALPARIPVVPSAEI